MSVYPDAIDGYLQLPVAIDGITKVNAASINVLREAILNIETELGTNPKGNFNTLAARIQEIEDTLQNATGVTDHAALTDLEWSVSAHTGDPDTIAGFDTLGATKFYQLGIELQAFSNELQALADLGDDVGFLKKIGDGSYLIIPSPLPVSEGGTGGTTVTTAQQGLGLELDIDVQRHSQELDALAGVPTNDFGIPFRTGVAAYSVGIVPVTYGGTGQSGPPEAFDALAPTSTLGDTIYHNGTDNVRLAGNTTATKKILSQTGDGVNSAAPSWSTLVSGDLPDNGVTFAKMQDIATDSLIGRDTAGSGDPENITLNATLSMTGTGALQRAALTGDITASAGSNATTLTDNVVSNSKLRDSAGLSVIGRAGTSSGDPADIVGSAGQYLQVNAAGTAVVFDSPTVSVSGLPDYIPELMSLPGTLIRSVTIPAGYAVSARSNLTIPSGINLTIGSGAVLEVIGNFQNDNLNYNAWEYGDGLDGDFIVPFGTTTTFSGTVAKNYRNLIVYGTFNIAGTSIRVSDTLTFGPSGVIHSGATANGNSGAGGGNHYGAGVVGAAGSATSNTNGNNGNNRSQSLLALRGGTWANGAGGNGGDAGGGGFTGGTGGTTSSLTSNDNNLGPTAWSTGSTWITTGGLQFNGGASGGSGAVNGTLGTEGGGGSSGGVCVVFARKVDATLGGIIHANGFVGGTAGIGAASGVGGGGGGGGGVAVLVYRTVIGKLPTLRALGGSGGPGAGTGLQGTGGKPGLTYFFQV